MSGRNVRKLKMNWKYYLTAPVRNYRLWMAAARCWLRPSWPRSETSNASILLPLWPNTPVWRPDKKSSGKTIRHVKSKSGNRKLNMAIHRIALSQISNSGNQYAKAYFKKKVSEGKSKNQALCCLKRKLVNIIYMMLKHRQAYNYQK